MYRVLYRKWRPKVFSEVIGQPQVTVTLSSQVRENRLSHAYLFTGSRGTGKTTCAKIFAKAVNCLAPVDGDPCNKCEICRSIDSGSALDIVEIDAASNRSIDDIRQLKEEANFTPSQTKYRVYIIDEVHMLTIEAFNALLKLLEEPPEHIKFVLATTEVQKLPATILSRCQRFDFRRIESEDIAERLSFIASAEGASLEKSASTLIARIADGSMRDALSLLDRCISVSDNVSVETVSSSVGLMDRAQIYKLARAISAGDAAKCLMLLDYLHKGSCDTERLCAELIDRFRSFLIVKTVEKPENLLVCTAEELEEIKNTADSFTKDGVLYALNTLTAASDAMYKTQNRRIEIEMALIRLCKPQTDDSAKGLAARISVLEKELQELKANGVKALGNITPEQKNRPTDAAPDISEKEKILAQEEEPPENKRFAGFGAEDASSSFADKFNKNDAGDDGEFDFDAFIKEHTEKRSDSQNADLPENDGESALGADDIFPSDNGGALPFDDDGALSFDDDVPPFDRYETEPFGGDENLFSVEPDDAESEKAINGKKWKKIIFETEKQFKPLIGQLTDSSAKIVGNNLYIRLSNKKLKIFINEAVLGRYVSQAAKLVLGKDYNIKIE